jgi:PAS domain-containing protein
LKSRVLILKDYIAWVKSHPDEYTIQMLRNKVSATENLFSSYENEKNFSTKSIPAAITDSLDETNKRSIIKVIILNNKNEVLYPEFPFRHKEGENTSEIIERIYKLVNYDQTESLVKNSYSENTNKVPYLIIKKSKIDDLNIGITFDVSQKKNIIQEVVLDSLSKVKYPNNEYVIINTFDGFALLSKGKRQIPAINIKNSTETNWKDVFTKELEFAKQMNGGYYTYLWRNNPNVERSEKTSYFSGINDWEWIIGTGFFTSDIYPVLQKLKSELYTDIRNNLLRFFIFMVILIVLAQLTMRYFAVKAKSNILLFLHFFKRAAQGMQIIDSNQLAFSEFDTLAQAANQMIHERERIKSVLSAEKSRLRYMIDAIPDLIFFKDVESKFLGCNTAFEKYINKKSEEIIGLSEYELFRKSDATGYNQTNVLLRLCNQSDRLIGLSIQTGKGVCFIL